MQRLLGSHRSAAAADGVASVVGGGVSLTKYTDTICLQAAHVFWLSRFAVAEHTTHSPG